MTATHVDGVAVIADEPALAAITTPDGRPIHFKQTRELLLEDGRIVYGCVECDFTRPNANAIRPHLRRHRAPGAPAPDRRKTVSELTLPQLLRQLDSMEKITAERDQWKARAMKAEKQLSTLRSALRDG